VISVGLTGNVASGKSSVADVWRQAGLPVISADALARDVVEPGTTGLAAVVEAFGSEVLTPDGSLDRDVLRGVVFQDKAAKECLESLLHPRIWTLRDQWMRAQHEKRVDLVVSEVPLLFEADLEADFHVTVVVDAPDEVRLNRLTHLRGMSEGDARRVMAAQLPSEEKRGRADRVLVNAGTLEDLAERAHHAELGLDQVQRRCAGQRVDTHPVG